MRENFEMFFKAKLLYNWSEAAAGLFEVCVLADTLPKMENEKANITLL